MKKFQTLIHGAILALACLFLSQCSTTPTRQDKTEKMHPNDPFRSTMVPSQFFEVAAETDNVVMGTGGTRIALPKGCLTDGRGRVYEGPAKIELAEALQLSDMLRSNLTTTSGGKPLVTDGMVYFNATTADGEQLYVNKDKPVYIEIPTNERQPGMMAYRGVRDENGNMDWVEPKEIENYLVPVDIKSLDFYPKNFEATVAAILPFNGHELADKAFTDSLYFSFNFSTLKQLMQALDEEMPEYNEPHHNKHKQIVDGKYTDDSYEVQPRQDSPTDSAAVEMPECGIDPASVKVIWSEDYQNSLLATREFEARMKLIHQTCHISVLEAYVKNLDRNLWELDSMAADAIMALPSSEEVHGTQDILPFHRTSEMEHVAEEFRAMSHQRLTKIKDGNIYAELLRGHYEKQLKAVQSELEAKQKEALKAWREGSPAAKKMATEYKEILWKREQHRMSSYGFEWSGNGWINVDEGTVPKTWGPQQLEVLVETGPSFDRVHTYVVYSSIKSLYRLNSSDQRVFHVGNADERLMNMPKQARAIAITVGYKKEVPYLAIEEFTTGAAQLKLTPNPTTELELQKTLSLFDQYSKENQVSVDLAYQAFFFREKQKRLEKREKLKGLIKCVIACCEHENEGPIIQSEYVN
ncbi:MAG: hypothetical protein IT258_21200 [Saprospiraceae bacterium]|nr:hypothetical protein [Saprospiraceae bacterium]